MFREVLVLTRTQAKIPKMDGLKLSIILIVLLNVFFTASSNPISNLFKKSDDDDDKAEDKTVAKAAEQTTTTTTTTTTTKAGESSCGGLKGFLHLCEKAEPTEPPKSVKTRSVPEEDSSSSSDEDDSDEDVHEGKRETVDEKNNAEEVETEQTVTGAANESIPATDKNVEKRQAEESDTAIKSEEPVVTPEELSSALLQKRQIEETETPAEDTEDGSAGQTGEDVEGDRRRRDCRDRYDDYYEKDCKKRRRRELVPCIEPKCKKVESMDTTE